MTPQELKNSILRFAVQGKLVPHDDSDNQIDLSGYKSKKTDDIDFDLPERWQIGHLECVTNNIPSKQYQILESQVLKEGKYAVISQSKDYSIGFSNDETKLFRHSSPVIVFGDHTAEVKIVDIDFVVGADGVKIFAPQDCLIPKYFYYVMQYLCIDLNKIGGYSRHYKYVKNQPIPLPPLAEQKRIVAKIEELLPLVDRYEEAYNKLEGLNKSFPMDLKKSILQMAIQGKLVPQNPSEGTGEELYKRIQDEKVKLVKEGRIKKGKPLLEMTEDEKPFDIPETWQWVRLRDICTKIVDGDHNPPTGVPNKTDFWMLSAQNINQSTLVDLDKVRYLTEDVFVRENERTKVESGDIFFTTVGTLGRTCVYEGGYNICFQRSVSVISTLVYNYYLKYVLDSPYIQQFMIRNATGTAQKGFYLNQVEKLVIPVPPVEEQKRIVAKLEEILPLCEKLV